MQVFMFQRPFGRYLLANSAARLLRSTGGATSFVGARSFMTTRLVRDDKKDASEKKPKKKATPKKEAKEKKTPKKAAEKKAPTIRQIDLKPPFKSPTTPFLKFFIEYLAKQEKSGQRSSAFATAASQEWSKLTPAEKKSYASTNEERERYAQQKKEWIGQLPPAHRTAYDAMMRKKRKARIGTGVLTSFALFTKEAYEASLIDRDLSFEERGKLTAQKYASLSEAEKDDLRRRAAEIMAERRKLPE